MSPVGHELDLALWRKRCSAYVTDPKPAEWKAVLRATHDCRSVGGLLTYLLACELFRFVFFPLLLLDLPKATPAVNHLHASQTSGKPANRRQVVKCDACTHRLNHSLTDLVVVVAFKERLKPTELLQCMEIQLALAFRLVPVVGGSPSRSHLNATQDARKFTTGNKCLAEGGSLCWNTLSLGSTKTIIRSTHYHTTVCAPPARFGRRLQRR